MKTLIILLSEKTLEIGGGAMAIGLIGSPLYAVWFGYHLFKRDFHRLHHLTMILFILLFIASGFLGWELLSCGCARARQSEAKTNLGAIFTSQVAYYSEYGAYAAGPECFKLLGWRPEGDTHYAYFCDGDAIQPTKPGATPVPRNFEMKEMLGSSETAFTVMAVGNIDLDSTLDVWIMPDSKNLSNVMNDIMLDRNLDVGEVKMSAIFAHYLGRFGSVYVLTGLELIFSLLLIGSIVRDLAAARKRS